MQGRRDPRLRAVAPGDDAVRRLPCTAPVAPRPSYLYGGLPSGQPVVYWELDFCLEWGIVDAPWRA